MTSSIPDENTSDGLFNMYNVTPTDNVGSSENTKSLENFYETAAVNKTDFILQNTAKYSIFPNSTLSFLYSNDSLFNSTNTTFPNETWTLPEVTLSEESLVGLIILYSITTVLSIAGNILVVLVFAKGRRSRTDLRLFLINLAAADLIMAIFCMPFTFADTIMRQWVFTKPLCPFVLFMQLLSVAASVFTNMAIGVDRFMAVTFPLHSRITYKRAKYVITVVWICSVLLSTSQLIVGRGSDGVSGQVHCIEQWPNHHSRKIYTVFILLLTYIMPLVILLITYSVVGILLWKRTTPGNKHEHRDLHQLRTKIKAVFDSDSSLTSPCNEAQIVKMLVIVVVMFGLCWLPIHAFTLVMDYNPELLEYRTEDDYKFFMGLYLAAHWLAMSNSFANPIIYGFTNEMFRADMIVLLHKWFPCCYCFKTLMIRTYSLSNYDSIIYRRTTLKRGGSVLNSSATTDSKRMRMPYRGGVVRDHSGELRRTHSEAFIKRGVINGVANGHVYSFRSRQRSPAHFVSEVG